MSDSAIHKVRLLDAKACVGFRPMLIAGDLTDAETTGWSQPQAAVKNENARNHGYAEGFAAAQAEFEIERAQLTQMIASADAIIPESCDELQTLIRETVVSLVHQIAGNAPIDGAWLHVEIQKATAIIVDCNSARSLCLHPSDAALVNRDLIHLDIKEDPALSPGSLRIECSAGWIEGGKSLYLEELRNMLGQQGAEA
jgi:flagellar assembly protein FliH